MKYLVPLVLFLSPVVFSGCKSGDTAGSSEAKAVEEAKLAESEESEVIAGVMDFLNAKFVVMDKEQGVDADGDKTKRNAKFIYDEFEYDQESGSLTFKELKSLSSNTVVGDKSVGFALSFLIIWQVDLASCSSVISIEEYQPQVFDRGSQKMMVVTFKGDHRGKVLKKIAEKTGDLLEAVKRSVEVLMTDKDSESLENQEFTTTNEDSELEMIVTQDMAPRLKAALSDLFKAHGVKASKY